MQGVDLRGLSYFDIGEAKRDRTARRLPIELEIERDGRRLEVVITPVPDPLWWPGVPAAVGSVLAASFLLP